MVTLGIAVGFVRGHSGVVVESLFQALATRRRQRAGPVFDRVCGSFLAPAVVREFVDQDFGSKDFVRELRLDVNGSLVLVR